MFKKKDDIINNGKNPPLIINPFQHQQDSIGLTQTNISNVSVNYKLEDSAILLSPTGNNKFNKRRIGFSNERQSELIRKV